MVDQDTDLSRIDAGVSPEPQLGHQGIGQRQLLCPDCGWWSAVDRWRECELDCEDCGSHPGMVCPRCDGRIDTIFREPEERIYFVGCENATATAVVVGPTQPEAKPEATVRDAK